MLVPTARAGASRARRHLPVIQPDGHKITLSTKRQRLPPTTAAGVAARTDAAGPNDWPPSLERAETRRVPDEDFAVHITTTEGSPARPGGKAIRGGCSPDTLTSPAV